MDDYRTCRDRLLEAGFPERVAHDATQRAYGDVQKAMLYATDMTSASVTARTIPSRSTKAPNSIVNLLETSIKRGSLGKLPKPAAPPSQPVGRRLEVEATPVTKYLQSARQELAVADPSNFDPFEVDSIDRTVESPTRFGTEGKPPSRQIDTSSSPPSPTSPKNSVPGTRNWRALEDSDDEQVSAFHSKNTSVTVMDRNSLEISETPSKSRSQRDHTSSSLGSTNLTHTMQPTEASNSISKPQQSVYEFDSGPQSRTSGYYGNQTPPRKPTDLISNRTSQHTVPSHHTTTRPLEIRRKPGQFGGVDPSALGRSTSSVSNDYALNQTPPRYPSDFGPANHWGADPYVTKPRSPNDGLPLDLDPLSNKDIGNRLSHLPPPAKRLKSVVRDPTPITINSLVLAKHPTALWVRACVIAIRPRSTSVVVRPQWIDLPNGVHYRSKWSQTLLRLYAKLWEGRYGIWKRISNTRGVASNPMIDPFLKFLKELSSTPLTDQEITFLSEELSGLLKFSTDAGGRDGTSNGIKDLDHLQLDLDKLPSGFMDYSDEEGSEKEARHFADEYEVGRKARQSDYEGILTELSYRDPSYLMQVLQTPKFSYMGGTATYATNQCLFSAETEKDNFAPATEAATDLLITGRTRYQEGEWVFANYDHRRIGRWSVAQVKKVFALGAQLLVRVFDPIQKPKDCVVGALVGYAYPIHCNLDMVQKWLGPSYTPTLARWGIPSTRPTPSPIPRLSQPLQQRLQPRLSQQALSFPRVENSNSSPGHLFTPSPNYLTLPRLTNDALTTTVRLAERERFFDDLMERPCRFPPPRCRWALSATPPKSNDTEVPSLLGTAREAVESIPSESPSEQDQTTKRVKLDDHNFNTSIASTSTSRSSSPSPLVLPTTDVCDPEDDKEIDEARVDRNDPTELRRLKLRMHKATEFWESRATPDGKWCVDDYAIACERLPGQAVERQIVRIAAISCLGAHVRIEYADDSLSRKRLEWIDVSAVDSGDISGNINQQSDITSTSHGVTSKLLSPNRKVWLEPFDAHENQSSRNEVDEFRTTLKGQGLALILEEMDGNCLFRAFSRQIFGSSDSHLKLRQFCTQFQRCHPDEFQCFLVEDIESYTQQMALEGVWGGEPEIVAMCRLFSVNCTVYIPGMSPQEVYDGFGSKAPKVRVSYHGSSHYNSVVVPEIYENTAIESPEAKQPITEDTFATDSERCRDTSMKGIITVADNTNTSKEMIRYRALFETPELACKTAETIIQRLETLGRNTNSQTPTRVELVQESDAEEDTQLMIDDPNSVSIVKSTPFSNPVNDDLSASPNTNILDYEQGQTCSHIPSAPAVSTERRQTYPKRVSNPDTDVPDAAATTGTLARDTKKSKPTQEKPSRKVKDKIHSQVRTEISDDCYDDIFANNILRTD